LFCRARIRNVLLRYLFLRIVGRFFRGKQRELVCNGPAYEFIGLKAVDQFEQLLYLLLELGDLSFGFPLLSLKFLVFQK